jgi:hypothetical protein
LVGIPTMRVTDVQAGGAVIWQWGLDERAGPMVLPEWHRHVHQAARRTLGQAAERRRRGRDDAEPGGQPTLF